MQIELSTHQKSMNRLLFPLLIVLTLLLSACGESQDTADSCGVDLDASRFSAVANNSSCSNYERASAYLGLAGVSVSEFTKDGAADNLSKTLNIQTLNRADNYTSGNRQYITNALCLVGSDNLTASARCQNNAVKRSGSRSCSAGDCEISMFANIADLMYVAFGVLDTSGNGELEDTEINQNANANLDNTGAGTDIISNTGLFEIIATNGSYIYDSDNNTCEQVVDNFSFVPSTLSPGCTTALSTSPTARSILKLDNMTDFLAGSDVTLGVVSATTAAASQLLDDFDDLGIASDSEFRKDMTDSINKLDNGGKAANNANCSNLDTFNVVGLLAKNAADNATVASTADFVNSTTANLVSASELLSQIDSSISLPTSLSASGQTLSIDTKVRLIYKSGSGYTDSYESADSYLSGAIANLKQAANDNVTAGDGVISFQELICYPEQ